jgi:hydrogenase nickel incorporation protein HypA/HybF
LGEETIHEAGIARNILRIAEEAAQANGLSVINRVEFEIGQFSGVDVAALAFALEALKRGTLLAGAEFAFQTPPLLLYCHACENEYLGDLEDLTCPACLGTRYEVIQGRELLVRSIAGA